MLDPKVTELLVDQINKEFLFRLPLFRFFELL